MPGWWLASVDQRRLTGSGSASEAWRDDAVYKYTVTGRWWVDCYLWYSEERTGRGCSSPRPFLTVPNVTAYPLAASVPTTALMYNGLLLRRPAVLMWQISKGLNSGNRKTMPDGWRRRSGEKLRSWESLAGLDRTIIRVRHWQNGQYTRNHVRNTLSDFRDTFNH